MPANGSTRRDALRGLAGAGAAGLAGCAALGAPTSGSNSETVRLLYMDVSGARTKEMFSPVVDRLNERTDRDVELEVNTVPYNNYRSKLFTMLGSDNPPDVAAVDQVWLGSLIDSGDLFALDDVAADIDFADHLPAFREAVTADGRVYAIPITTDVRGMYWNRGLFEAAGLDPGAPPETWEELIDTAATLHDPPATYGAAYLTVSGRWAVNLYAAGGRFLSADGTEPRFQSEAGVRAARFLQDIYTERAVSSPNPRYQSGARLAREFLTGQYAIDVVDGSWLHAFWENVRTEEVPIEKRFGFAPTPGPAEGEAATMSGGFVWTGYEATDHPELVKEFLRLVGQRSFKRELAIASRRIPTRASLLDDEAVWNEIPFAETKREMLDRTATRPVWNWQVVAERLDPALQRIAFGIDEPEASLRQAAREVRSVL